MTILIILGAVLFFVAGGIVVLAGLSACAHRRLAEDEDDRPDTDA